MEQMTHNGVTLAFEDAGKGMPSLLLVRDLSSGHTSLLSQFEHFRSHHRVVAVELPGHSWDHPAPWEYLPGDFAEDLAWLCYELGVYRPVAIGHGLGGTVAVELAVKFPDLLAAVVVQDTPLLAHARARADSKAAPARPFETLKNAMNWDGAAALARCRLPMLYIETGTASTNADRLRQLNPGLTVESVRSGYLRQGEVTMQVNALIEAFLLSLHA